MKEEFRWIEGFEDSYQISNLGRVYSFPRIDTLNRVQGGGYLSTSVNPSGYVVVTLNKDGAHSTYYIHRLVAQAFIPNPANKPEVDHIDGNKQNNNVFNLRWATKKENMNNPVTYAEMSNNARKNPVSGSKNPFSRKVAQYSMSGVFIAEYESTGIASKATKISMFSIQRCAAGKRKSGGGFIWKYTSKARMIAKGRIPEGTNGTPIVQTDLSGNIISEYVSIQQAARQTGFLSENIYRAVVGKFKFYKGYKWLRKEQ